ncbi:MAG: hypothetical protein AAGG09_03665 [Pseudomonadota bacterium]
MKLSLEVIKSYTRNLTMGRGASAPDPMSDLSQFNADAATMAREAAIAGDLVWLKIALDALIANPDGRIGQFAGQQYPFNEPDLVRLFSHAYHRIWPGDTLSAPGDEADVTFEVMSDEDWAIAKAPLGS